MSSDRVNRTERLWIRVTAADKELLERAALYTRQSVSGFIMSVVLPRAERLMSESGLQADLPLAEVARRDAEFREDAREDAVDRVRRDAEFRKRFPNA